MNKQFLVPILTVSLLLLGGGGCQNNLTDQSSALTTSTPQAVVTSTPEVSATTTTSLINRPVSEWPRYEFKELGFSMQAPFPIGQVTSTFHDCSIGQDRCDSQDMRWFGASIGPVYLTSWSPNFNFGGELGNLVHEFRIENGRYYFVWDPGTPEEHRAEIKALSVLHKQGITLVVYDAFKYFFQKKAQSYSDSEKRNMLGLIFSLPNNKNFRAAHMEVDLADNFNKSLLLKMANSIIFSP